MWLCALLKCYSLQIKEKKKIYKASKKLGHEEQGRTYIVTQNHKCYNAATSNKQDENL